MDNIYDGEKAFIIHSLMEHLEYVKFQMGPFTWDRGILQGAIGIIDEARELRECEYDPIPDMTPHAIEELGDILFYSLQFAEALSMVTIYSTKEILSDVSYERVPHFKRYCRPEDSQFLSLVKKVVFQKRGDLLEDMKFHFIQVFEEVVSICNNICFDEIVGKNVKRPDPIPFILNKNKEKLLKRYPNGFSTKASKNRPQV